MPYVLALDVRVHKFLKPLPQKQRQQIALKLVELTDNPRPNDCAKFHGDAGFRVTIGEYRILYDIDEKAKWVHVLKIMKRNDEYKP